MPQERFSRREWLLGYPPFRASFCQSMRLNIFDETKTMWTLTSLWAQRTRPQGSWKRANSALFHSAHIDHLFFKKKTTERGTNDRNTLAQLSTKSDQVHPERICDVTWTVLGGATGAFEPKSAHREIALRY